MAEEGDDATKLARLLQEYNKIKKQNTILKKAVIQEKQTTQQLQTELKERDVAHRKAREENEILTFNNQRLTKRLTKLQEDINSSRKSDAPGWFSSGSKNELSRTKQSLEVTRQELAIKIEENESLHIRMFEQKQAHKQIVDELEGKLKHIEESFAASQSKLQQISENHEEEVERLQFDVKQRSLEIDQLAKSLQRSKELFKEQSKEQQTIRTKLEQDIHEARSIITRHVPLDDTKDSKLNENNLPSLGLQYKSLTEESRESCLQIITELVEAFTEYYTEQIRRENCILRSGVLDEERDLKAVHKSIEKTLQNVPKLTEKIKQAGTWINDAFSKTNSLEDETNRLFLQSIQNFVMCNEKLLSLHKLCLHYPNTRIPQVEQYVEELIDLQNSWESVVACISIFFVPVDQGNYPTQSSYIVMYKQLIHTLRDLQRKYKKCVIAYDRVAQFEAHSVRDEHKNANEQISKSMGNIVVLLGRLVASIDEIQQVITRTMNIHVHGVQQKVFCPHLYRLENRTRAYTNVVNSMNSYDSVPYSTAITNQTFILEVQKNKSEYERKIQEGLNRLQEEEKEKERIIKEWTATRDALAAKKDHITSLLTELSATRQKYKEALESGQTSGNDLSLDQSIHLNETIDTSDHKGYKMTVIDENAQESSSLNVTKIDRERETAIKQHFQAKRAQLLAQMKIADEKAMKYYEEYKTVKTELELVSKQNQTRKEALEAAQAHQLKAMEDLESTRRNYEDQMQVMTEHFMGLNDKLGKQEDALSRLKSHKVHCARCGTWNTVAWLIGPDGLNGRRCSRGNHPSSYNYS